MIEPVEIVVKEILGEALIVVLTLRDVAHLVVQIRIVLYPGPAAHTGENIAQPAGDRIISACDHHSIAKCFLCNVTSSVHVVGGPKYSGRRIEIGYRLQKQM